MAAMVRLIPGVLLVFAVGCGGAGLPRTYPAGGVVVYKGGQPLKGGSIQFESADDPLLRVIGTIEPDGHFTLTTIKDAAKAEGAPAGDYKVIVQPPSASDPRGDAPAGHKGVAPITLPKTYRVEANDNNTLRIELPLTAPKS
jgi:hypothetical protein